MGRTHISYNPYTGTKLMKATLESIDNVADVEILLPIQGKDLHIHLIYKWYVTLTLTLESQAYMESSLWDQTSPTLIIGCQMKFYLR